MKKSAVNSCIKVLLIASCIVFLCWMIAQAGPMQLWQTLISMPLTILGCVMIWGVGYWFNTVSFRQILLAKCKAESQDSSALGWMTVLRLTVSGYALNYITPFGLSGGEPYRIWSLRPVMGVEKATQSVVLYSMMHIGSHFCFWLLSTGWILITLQDDLAAHWFWILLAIICLVLLLALFWLGYSRGIVLKFMQRWIQWPLLNPKSLPSGSLFRSLLAELLSRLINVVEYWLIMRSLGFDTFGYGDALLVVAFSSLIANILFFSPLQMGTREGGIILALQWLVPSVTTALGAGSSLLALSVTLSFATRLREFIWIAIGLMMMRISSPRQS